MASAALEPGLEIGPFRILKLLGEGGVGRVYAALDTELERPVALKALRPEVSHDSGFVERFRGEAASLARLQHPNITTLYSLHRNGRDLYMVMEMVRGYTLEEVLHRQPRLDTHSMRALAAQACAGLAYAHRMGVIHRDIKPSNLMLTETGLLKIMDFGIARVRGSARMTRAGSIVGTLAYMPPEQIKGADNDERSDIYSLGCVLYELLCGSPPFTASSEYELIQAQIGQAPPGLGGRCIDLDPAVGAALTRALDKQPVSRFPDAGSFARALGTQMLAADPDDVAQSRVLSRMPPLPSLDLQVSASGKTVAATRPAKPAKRVKAENARATPAWLPLAALGGAALLVAGFVGFTMIGNNGAGHDPAGAAQPAQTVSETEEISPSALKAALPANPNIMPAPDADATNAARIMGASQAKCVSGDDSGFVEGHVDGVSEEGWPQIGGAETHLYGVHELSADAHQRLANWLSKKGDQVACCVMGGDAQLCRTTGTHHQDLSVYLLLNGLAHADGGAPDSYVQAEENAKSARRGIWQ